ncbi:MAG: hypothetical protein ACFFCW_04455 [Candidatus Hodarchaeota archaeon]
MGELIGWNKSAARITGEVLRILNSREPYYTFAIQGERRGGRSTFFGEMARIVDTNPTSGAICFVGQLNEASVADFASSLLKAMEGNEKTSRRDSFQGEKLLHPDGFFELVSEVIKRDQKKPVFLLDMGPALEDATNDAIREVAFHLKIIANLMKNRNIPFALGCGWTKKFFDKAIVIAGDVYRDRYPSVLFLGCGFEESPPFGAFQAIVKKITSVNLPNRFSGLLRVPGITAGMYGENLKCHGIQGEPRSEDIWKSLQGEYSLIPQLSSEDISLPSSDLAELLLADGRVDQNFNNPDFLVLTQEREFQASEALYEKFGLMPPRRDPTAWERLRNRLSDFDDDQLLTEILSAFEHFLKNWGKAEECETLSFQNRTGILSVKLNQVTRSDEELSGSEEINAEIDQLALPNYLTIGLYLDSPDCEEFEKALIDCVKKGNFVFVLFLEGKYPIDKTPIGRKIKELGYPWYVKALSEEDFNNLLLSEADDFKNWETIQAVVDEGIRNHLAKKPTVPVLYEKGKKIFNAVIANAGKLDIEKIKENLSLTKQVCQTLCDRIAETNIVQKKRGFLFWNPAEDPVLGILLGEEKNPVIINKQLSKQFTLPSNGIPPSELVSWYTGVFGQKEINEIDHQDVVDWYMSHRPQLVALIEQKLQTEPVISEEFRGRLKKLKDTLIDNWDDISGDRETLEELKTEISNAIRTLADQRQREKEELENRKSDLRQSLGENENLFTIDERATILGRIEAIQTLSSRILSELRTKIKQRRSEFREFENRVQHLETRLRTLEELDVGEKTGELSDKLLEIKESLGKIDFEGLDGRLKDLEDRIEALEKEHKRREIFGGTTASLPKTPKEDYTPVSPPPKTLKEGDTKTIPPPPKTPREDDIPVSPPSKTPTEDDMPVSPPPLENKIFYLSDKKQVRNLLELLNDRSYQIKRIEVKLDKE